MKIVQVKFQVLLEMTIYSALLDEEINMAKILA